MTPYKNTGQNMDFDMPPRELFESLEGGATVSDEEATKAAIPKDWLDSIENEGERMQLKAWRKEIADLANIHFEAVYRGSETAEEAASLVGRSFKTLAAGFTRK